MSNMSYCRFQNTASDLHDCLENLCSLDPNNNGYNEEAERHARARIIKMAARLIDELCIEDPADEEEVLNAIAQLDEGYGYQDECWD